MVILHVTANMTKVVNELKREGEIIEDEVLAGLSPYLTGHINRRGIFVLDFNKEVIDLEYGIV